ncbi:heterokaryon incompatibility protein-domain-containing protein [Lophiotrema nucula]|uniref:Heterokaryon incompatibility protein-domain-containing protein n=1 Tax=Lophiotrema nucula TaxID=690887 RepID=A0A6A5ZSS9_9PLEO|nr:heterokaryon incompatibility protein-domain-containing protein [Lophiotrema nucula]
MDPIEDQDQGPINVPTYAPDDLCKYCRDLDLDSAFSSFTGIWNSWFGRKSRPLNPAIHGWAPLQLDCPLCQFFSTLRSADPGTRDEAKAFCLRRRRAADVFDPLSDKPQFRSVSMTKVELNIRKFVYQEASGRILVVEPEGGKDRTWLDPLPCIIFNCSPKSKPKHIHGYLPKLKFDANEARKWLEHCLQTSSHTQCSEKKLKGKNVLRVIDCSNKRLLDLPSSAKYVCLSYCWGDFRPASPSADGLPALPQTIKDAISVVLDLGFTYLWVDAYCIDQGNALAKHIDIRRMDKIYRGATLTIIAATGTSASHGLPGVSRPWNTTSLQTLRLGKTTLLAGIERPEVLLNTSPWNQRGWTFQEGLLSTRRLVFTEKEAIFQCASMCVMSSFHCPPSLTEMWHGLPDTESQRLRSYPNSLRDWANMDWQRSSLNMFDDVSFVQASAWSMISQFLLRTLSYEQDIINAVSGILDVLFDGKHHFALPYSLGSLNDRRFRESLLWTHSDIAREWSTTELSRYTTPREKPRCLHRRDGFPSWSWAGWKNWDSSSSMLRTVFTAANVDNDKWDGSISVFDGIRGLSLSELKSKPRQQDILNEPSTQYLIIETWVLRCDSAETFSEDGNGGFKLHFHWGPHEPSSYHVDLENESELSPRLDLGRVYFIPLHYKGFRVRADDPPKTKMFYTGAEENFTIDTQIEFLVVARRRAGSDSVFGEIYERIGSGFARFSHAAYREFGETAFNKERIVLG